MVKHNLLISTAICCVAFTTTAYAQALPPSSTPTATTVSSDATTTDTADTGIGDIIVTANRRAENLQQVPISVAAFKGEALKVLGVVNVVDLPQITPGLGFTRTIAGTNAFLRGVGTTTAGYSTEVPIATYIDGLYLPNSAASSFSFNNIERVEVLKGPQGTLYGRNTTGGLIQVITKDPGADTSIDTSISYGNYDTIQANFYGSTPLTENLAINFAALFIDQIDGWGTNVFTGKQAYTFEDLGFQAKLQWKPGPDTKVTLRGFYDRTKTDEGDAVGVFPGTVSSDGTRNTGEYNINSRLTPYARQRIYSISLKAEHTFNFATVSSLTGYINNESPSLQTQAPVLGTTAPGQSAINFGGRQRARTFEQEFQITSNSTGPFKWLAGAFFYDDQTTIDNKVYGTCIGLVCSPGITPSDTMGHQHTRSYSGYGEGTYSFRTGTHVTLGLRYTSDEKVFTGIITPLAGFPSSIAAFPPTFVTTPAQSGIATDVTFNKLTYKAVLAQDLTDEIHVYASYNRGFKSGGFNPTTFTNPASAPEVLDDFEVGVKSELFDRLLRLNVAGFYYNYRGIQLRATVPPAPPGSSILFNAASAHNYGADVDFVLAPAKGLTINGGFEFLNARYTNFPAGILTIPRVVTGTILGGNISTTANLTGFQEPQAPDFSASIGVTYVVPTSIGEFELNANDGYRSSFSWEPDNRLRQAAYHLVNAAITYRPVNSRFSLQVFARNLNGAYYAVSAAAGSGGDAFLPGAPRTYGARARYNF